jgi:glycosyltransferase involved in cell wall biosynthesis
MNILLINHYAGSLQHGMEYRPYYFAREWVRMGHQVTIVAASESHVRSVSPEIKGAITKEVIDGIDYFWLKTPKYHGNGIWRVVNIFAFVTQLYRFANAFLEKKPDVVITSSTHPLDNFPGKWIAQQAGANLVYEVHDLWPLSLIELGGMSKYHPFVQLIRVGENFAYRNANYVVSLLPMALPHMRSHGLASEKFIYVPNGIDVEEWEGQSGQLPQEHVEILANIKQQFKFLVGYAGAHGLANGLDSVLDAAKQLENASAAFILVGQGPEKQRLQFRCTQEGIENVFFLTTISKSAIPSFLSEMDALYIGLKSEPLFRFGVSPNKLMDYMMAGKPIVYAITSGNTPVADANCGIMIPPENPEMLAKSVRQLLDASQADLMAMGLRGREYCLQNHDYHQLAKNFLNVVTR